MSIEQRRKFLKGFGIFGALAAGAATTHVIVEKHTETKLIPASVPKVDPSMVTMIEEQTPSTLTLSSTYGTIAPPPPPPKEAMRVNSDGTVSMNYTPVTWASPQAGLTLEPNGSLRVLSNNKNFVPGSEKNVLVKMVPGPDGELYLNVNGEWKRVLTA